MENVQAVDLVALGNGKVEADQGKDVGFWNPQRGVQAGYEIWHLVETDELGGMRIVSAKQVKDI